MRAYCKPNCVHAVASRFEHVRLRYVLHFNSLYHLAAFTNSTAYCRHTVDLPPPLGCRRRYPLFARRFPALSPSTLVVSLLLSCRFLRAVDITESRSHRLARTIALTMLSQGRCLRAFGPSTSHSRAKIVAQNTKEW